MNSLQNPYITPHIAENTLYLAEGSNKKPRPQPFKQLPTEINEIIFSYLNWPTLNQCSRVSHEWKKLASSDFLWDALDLKTLFPHLRVFNELDWKTHIDLSSLGLSVEDAPPSNKRKEIPILKKLLSLSIEGNAGITLLTIPQGLTFNKLVKLAGSPKLGKATNFRYIFSRIYEIEDIPVDKTYRIVITNNVLSESQSLSFNDQKSLVLKFGCNMSKVLEVVTLLVVTYINSQQRLYNGTYARCLEKVDSYQVVVGGFSPSGLYVGHDYAGNNQSGVGCALQLPLDISL